MKIKNKFNKCVEESLNKAYIWLQYTQNYSRERATSMKLGIQLGNRNSFDIFSTL